MQEIRHNAGAARYLYGTPAGLLEYRITAAVAVGADLFITHRPGCDGEHCNEDCDADHGTGAEIATVWENDGDEAVFRALADHAEPETETAGIDISNAPAPLINATKAAIVRCWTDGRSLEDAILDASADTYTNALARGCDGDQAERLGMFVAAVGAHMQASVRI